MSGVTRAVATQKLEARRLQGESGVTAERERLLEVELSRAKAEHESASMVLQRKMADLQNANSALQRQLSVSEDEAGQRLRELENAK